MGGLIDGFVATYKYLKNNNILAGYPFKDDIARGRVGGSRQAQIEGMRKIIPSGNSDITNLSTQYVPIPPLAGLAMEVVSTSSDDTLGGVGANKVIVEYIDPADLKLKQVEISLNGTVAVTIPVSIGFVSDFYVSDAPTLTATNVGILKINSGATTYAQIDAGDCKSLSAVRYIPADKNFYITSVAFSGDTKGVVLKIEATQTDNLTSLKNFICRGGVIMSDSPAEIAFDPPMVITGGNYVKTTINSSSSNTGLVGTCLNGWLENKEAGTLN